MAITSTDLQYMATLAYEAGERLQQYYPERPVTPTAAVHLLHCALVNDTRQQLDPELNAQTLALESRIRELRERRSAADLQRTDEELAQIDDFGEEDFLE